MRNVPPARDRKIDSGERLNLQLFPLCPHSPFFRMLAAQPFATAAVTALIGAPLLLETSAIFWEPARRGTGTSWHTDNNYFELDDPLAGTAMWTPIHDATTANGTLRVIPNAFSEQWPRKRDADRSDHGNTDVGDREVVYAELPAGGVAFFCYGTPHATADNTSDRPRAAIAFHYTNASRTDPSKHRKAGLASGDAVSAPTSDPGEWDEGAFARMVDRLLGANAGPGSTEDA